MKRCRAWLPLAINIQAVRPGKYYMLFRCTARSSMRSRCSSALPAVSSALAKLPSCSTALGPITVGANTLRSSHSASTST